MSAYLVLKAAGFRLDDIYQYTLNEWGEKQAEKYIRGLFEHFVGIADQSVLSHPIPAEFGVDGFVSKYEKHYVYWKSLSGGQVGIVTVLHERMHQIERFQKDIG